MNFRSLIFCALLLSFPAASRGETNVADCTSAALLAAIRADTNVIFEEACTIALTNQVVISRDTSIDGGGFDVNIVGAGSNRLFVVRNGAKLTLSGLRLADGQSSIGGAIYVTTGCSAVITNCFFERNIALGEDGLDGVDGENGENAGEDGADATDGYEASGGAIFSAGSLQLLVCQFATNSATGGNGGLGGTGGSGVFEGGSGGNGGNGGGAFGGAVYCAGPLLIRDCLFLGNNVGAGDGGLGGDPGGGPFQGVAGSAGQGADAEGGAVFSGGTAEILSSTFQGNSAAAGDSAEGGTDPSGSGQSGYDGGLAAGGGVWASSAGITNSTFYLNSASGGNGARGGPGRFNGGEGGDGGNGQGGAMLVFGLGRVVNCTFLDNNTRGGTNGAAGSGPFAGKAGAAGKALGGHLSTSSGILTLKNTILGTNATGNNVYGNITDAGHNIVADTSFKIQYNTSRRTFARLEALAYNGGPTPTFALATNSIAVNGGDNAWAPKTDQRGVRRPVGPFVDIGAYERSLTVSGRVTAGDSGLAGVLVNVGEVEVETDSQGFFSAPSGNGLLTITPVLPGYVFTPGSIVLPNVTNSVTNIVFTAVRFFTISGRVLQGTNSLGGVQLLAGTNTTISASNGNFSFTLSAGSYTLSATSACFRFIPASTNFTTGSGAARFEFQALPDRYTISGRVTAGTNGPPFAGVLVSVAGLSGITGTNGFYSISNLCKGAYVVSASAPGYGFIPETISATVAQQDVTNANFIAIAGLTLSGSVTEGGVPLSSVRLIATNAAFPQIPVAFTGTNGTFTLLGLQTNAAYTITPAMPGYGFEPPMREVQSQATQTNTVQFFARPLLRVSVATNKSSLQLTFGGNSGQPYTVENSTNLVDWRVIYTNVSPIQFSTPTTTNGASYYRLRGGSAN